MAYVYVNGNTNALDTIAEHDQIMQVLHWIGFTNDNQKNSIFNDSINSFSDLYSFSTSDITDMAKDYANRHTNNGRMHFGICRIKKLKAFMFWVQDFRRIDKAPTIEGMNETDFLKQLDQALEQAKIRNQHREDSDIKSKEASPGPLKSEKDWVDWESKFVNYLSTLTGVNGVPLSYIVRENELPPTDGRVYSNFMEETVYCAPLNGTIFDADKNTVHQAILSFTTGYPSEDWIKDKNKYRDGCRSMKALRDHFAGEGNATRRIAEADRLKKSLHYKNERSLAFETFLTRSQKMFNIYEKEGEAMTEDAKLRFLFDKTQHPTLTAQVAALEAQITAGANISYTTAANHLSTAVSKLPEFLSKNRVIGAVTSSGTGSIYKEDGSIKADQYIPNWNELSAEDRSKVMAERKRLNIRLGRGGKGHQNPKGGKNSGQSSQALKKQNSKFKRQIKALKRKMKSKDDNDNDANNSESEEEKDAGDSFGGRESKKNQKKKNKK